MWKRMFFFIVVLTNVLAIGNCNESALDSQTATRLETLAAVLEDLDGSALDLSLERVYIDPHKISISERGVIAYEVKSKTVVLPELCSSAESVVLASLFR